MVFDPEAGILLLEGWGDPGPATPRDRVPALSCWHVTGIKKVRTPLIDIRQKHTHSI